MEDEEPTPLGEQQPQPAQEAQQQQQAEVGEEERATDEEQKNAVTKLQKPEPPPRPSRVGRPPLFSAASRYNGDEEAEEGQYRKPTQRRAGPLVLDNRHQLGSSSSSSEEEEQKNEWSDEDDDDDDDKEEEEERPWENPFSRFDRTYGGGNRTADHYLRPREGRNYRFYAGLMASQPDGDTIDNMHKRWFGNHSLLEYHHGFIQWLFPVFESGGVNWHAEPLSKHDAKLIRQDFTLATRVIKSYRLMLHFYGMRLASEETGEVERWPGIWKERYRNLDWNSHNNLRINRILTSLGELGFQRWKQPLVEHFTKEIIHNRLLPSCRYSLQSFWKETLNVDSSRYRMKTREDPEDREDSVFFQHMQQNTEEYQKWRALSEVEYPVPAKQGDDAEEANSNVDDDDEDYARYRPTFSRRKWISSDDEEEEEEEVEDEDDENEADDDKEEDDDDEDEDEDAKKGTDDDEDDVEGEEVENDKDEDEVEKSRINKKSKKTYDTSE